MLVALGLSLVLLIMPEAASSEPSEVHLSFGKSPDEMRVMWVTSSIEPGVVEWATSEEALASNPKRSNASMSTYTITDMCGAPANNTASWVDPGQIHDASMTGLRPAAYGPQPIFYRVGSTGNWSRVFNFTVGPKCQRGCTRFLAFGDMGVASRVPSAANSTSLLSARASSSDFVLHVGDLSYAVGHGAVWKEFGEQIAPIASRVPWMVSIGNHEYDYPGQPFAPPLFTYNLNGHADGGGECGVPYNARFHMPGPPLLASEGVSMPGGKVPPATAKNNLYYSFQSGLVHVSIISSEHDMLPGSPQHTWLDNNLGQVNRTETPWVVFGTHRPFFDSSSASVLPELGIMRRALEPLMITHAVDLVLFGHIHQYTRSCRMVDHKCDSSPKSREMWLTPVGASSRQVGKGWIWIQPPRKHPLSRR